MIRRNDRQKTLLGVVHCDQVALNGPTGKPFFSAKLSKAEGSNLLHLLDELGQHEGPGWYLLAASSPDPKRLRLVDFDRTPAYELDAEGEYLRGELFRVTGKEDSCNINFSGPVGARLIAERLRAALARADSFIDIVVPNRHGKKDLIEFIPDTDRESEPGQEHERLALAGDALAADLLVDDDFSDWE
jgi:hypothetical protein